MRRFGLVRSALLVAGLLACATTAPASPITDLSSEGLGHTNLNDATVVPEPGAMLLVGTGLLLAARRLRKTS